MWPGAVADTLARFEWAFRQPGRYLGASQVWQPVRELEYVRDDLERSCIASLAVPAAISAAWSLVSTMSSSVALCRTPDR
jgi:hypothetical protein